MYARRRRRAAGLPSILLPALLPLLIACQLLEVAPTADFKVLPATAVTAGTTVTLDGSTSTDPQSYQLSYDWSLTSPAGSAAHLSATDRAVVSFTPDLAGTYTVLLRVTSKSGSRKTDQTSKNIVVTEAGGVMTDAESVAADKATLEIGYAAGDSASSVTQDLVLPTVGAHDTSISWQSDHPAVITSGGGVTRPAEATGVLLTATITKGDASDSRQFSLTVIATGAVDPVVGAWTLSTVNGISAAAADMAENLTIAVDNNWSASGVFQGQPFQAGGTWSASGEDTYTVTFLQGAPEGTPVVSFTINATHNALSTTIDDQLLVFVPGSVVLPPTALQASDVSTDAPAIRLIWTASLSPGVTAYIVRRGTSQGAISTLVATLPGSSSEYVDDDDALEWDVPYYYVVTSLSGTEESTVASNPVSLSPYNPAGTGTIKPVID